MWVILLGRATHALKTWTTSVGVQVHTLLAASICSHIWVSFKKIIWALGQWEATQTGWKPPSVGLKCWEWVGLPGWSICTEAVLRLCFWRQSQHSLVHQVIHSFNGKKVFEGNLRRYQQVWWGWQRMLYYATQLLAFQCSRHPSCSLSSSHPAPRITFFVCSLPTSKASGAQLIFVICCMHF